jgi:hypothetical protein
MLQRLDGYDAGTVGEKIRLGRKSCLRANKSFGVQTTCLESKKLG